MKNNVTRPPDRDLPREVVFRRRAHLVDELTRLRRARRTPRRPLYLVFALLILLAIAAPALGLESRLRHFLAGEPAPAPVKDVFARQLPRSVIAERAHGVMAIRTASGHRVILWAAPTRLGGRCTFLQIEDEETSALPGPSGSLGCVTREGLARPKRPVIASGTEATRLRDGSLLQLLFGTVSRSSGIRSLELRSPNRRRLVLRLVRGFFLVERPPALALGTLVGRAGNGRVVARRALPPLVDQTSPADVPASGRTIRARAVYGGHQWYMFTARRGGQFCVGANLGGPEERGCNTRRPERFTEGPIELTGPGASQDPGNSSGTWDRVWFYGFVAPAVAQLVLLSSDCSRETVPIQRGAFLHLANPERLHAGAVPSLLLAYDSSGEEVGRALLHLVAAGRPDSEYPSEIPPARCGGSKKQPAG